MWNLVVFAVIGLVIGGAARLLYPGRQSTHILGTMLVGIIGAVVGGMISWIWWPDVDGLFQTGNLIFAAVGALAVILIWAGVTYQRGVQGKRATS
ncbi:MAG: GlsB/YeaQ/YmgE family stress response membrane protein [Gemmataceae bacterium]